MDKQYEKKQIYTGNRFNGQDNTELENARLWWHIWIMVLKIFPSIHDRITGKLSKWLK